MRGLVILRIGDFGIWGRIADFEIWGDWDVGEIADWGILRYWD